jgi:nitrate reductase delta subunit
VTAEALKLMSLLLQYPSAEQLAARPELREAAAELPPGRGGREIRRFLDWYCAVPGAELQSRYVDTFDFTKRSSLHLTYHTFGDRRQRGLALLNLKQRYAAAGLDLLDGELPDYLPVMLECAALAPDAGVAVLARNHEALELVRASLHEAESPWALLLDATCAALPPLTKLQGARVRRLAAEGPPFEEVGLEPFAPPDVMPPAHDCAPRAVRS